MTAWKLLLACGILHVAYGVATPSASPSSRPSAKPSASPSGRPTTKPSGRPSINPSAPSTKPTSSNPSMGPSTGPSKIPTATPSTGLPTAHPSKTPTQPSAQPTINPTSPSAQPTNNPVSTNPSINPTKNPTAPSKHPTPHPSPPPTPAPTPPPSPAPTPPPTPPPTPAPTPAPSPAPTPPPTPPPTPSPTMETAIQILQKHNITNNRGHNYIIGEQSHIDYFEAICTAGINTDTFDGPTFLHNLVMKFETFKDLYNNFTQWHIETTPSQRPTFYLSTTTSTAAQFVQNTTLPPRAEKDEPRDKKMEFNYPRMIMNNYVEVYEHFGYNPNSAEWQTKWNGFCDEFEAMYPRSNNGEIIWVTQQDARLLFAELEQRFAPSYGYLQMWQVLTHPDSGVSNATMRYIVDALKPPQHHHMDEKNHAHTEWFHFLIDGVAGTAFEQFEATCADYASSGSALTHLNDYIQTTELYLEAHRYWREDIHEANGLTPDADGHGDAFPGFDMTVNNDWAHCHNCFGTHDDGQAVGPEMNEHGLENPIKALKNADWQTYYALKGLHMVATTANREEPSVNIQRLCDRGNEYYGLTYRSDEAHWDHLKLAFMRAHRVSETVFYSIILIHEYQLNAFRGRMFLDTNPGLVIAVNEAADPVLDLNDAFRRINDLNPTVNFDASEDKYEVVSSTGVLALGSEEAFHQYFMQNMQVNEALHHCLYFSQYGAFEGVNTVSTRRNLNHHTKGSARHFGRRFHYRWNAYASNYNLCVNARDSNPNQAFPANDLRVVSLFCQDWFEERLATWYNQQGGIGNKYNDVEGYCSEILQKEAPEAGDFSWFNYNQAIPWFDCVNLAKVQAQDYYSTREYVTADVIRQMKTDGNPHLASLARAYVRDDHTESYNANLVEIMENLVHDFTPVFDHSMSKLNYPMKDSDADGKDVIKAMGIPGLTMTFHGTPGTNPFEQTIQNFIDLGTGADRLTVTVDDENQMYTAEWDISEALLLPHLQDQTDSIRKFFLGGDDAKISDNNGVDLTVHSFALAPNFNTFATELASLNITAPMQKYECYVDWFSAGDKFFEGTTGTTEAPTTEAVEEEVEATTAAPTTTVAVTTTASSSSFALIAIGMITMLLALN